MCIMPVLKGSIYIVKGIICQFLYCLTLLYSADVQNVSLKRTFNWKKTGFVVLSNIKKIIYGNII